MKVSLFFISTIFLAPSGAAMDVVQVEQELEQILQRLAAELASAQGDEDQRIKILRTQTDGKNIDGLTDYSAKSANEELIGYLQKSKYFVQLRDDIDKAIAQIPKNELEPRELENSEAKLLVAIIGSSSLAYFSPILKEYEKIIKPYYSEKSRNMTMSFFSLYIINKILFDKCAIAPIKDRKLFSKPKKKSSNENIKNIAANLQKRVTGDEAAQKLSQIPSSIEIGERLQLLSDNLLGSEK